MKASIEITRSNHSTDCRPLDGSKISLGRSSRCDIALPDEPELQAEHLFIIPDEAGCQIELTKQAPAPFSFQGRPLRKGMIPWGEDIFINRIRLRMVREPTEIDRKMMSPRFILVALPLLCASAWLLLGRSPAADSHDSGGVAASPLFDKPIECSQPNLALYRAGEAERTAFAKMERYPFMHQDGVEAVRLISEARNCYQAAGEAAQVARVQKALDTWTRRLEQDYQNLRLRLRLARVGAQRDEARRTVRILRNLLSHRNDNYTKWLDRVEQKLNTH
jgi:hypothetical protein